MKNKVQKFVSLILFAVISICPLFILSGCNNFDRTKPSLKTEDGWYVTHSTEFADYSTIEEVYEKTPWKPVPHGERHAGYWCDEVLDVDNEEGALVVKSYVSHNHTCDKCPKDGIFTCGVDTRQEFLQAFGYFEATVKVPVGYGMWSAFWLQTENVGNIGHGGEDGTEIDVYESSFIRKNRTKTGNALHYDAYEPPFYHYGDNVTDVGYDLYDGQYHKYAVWWNPQYYVFYVDDKPVWATDYAGVSKVPEYMMLTVEIKGDEYGPYGQKLGNFENRTDNGNNFYVKSVKVWQNESYKASIKSINDFDDKEQEYTILLVVGSVLAVIVGVTLIIVVVKLVKKHCKKKKESKEKDG